MTATSHTCTFLSSDHQRSPMTPDEQGHQDSVGDVTTTSDPARFTLHLVADPRERFPLCDLYKPVVDWIDPDLCLFRVTESAPKSKPCFTEQPPTPNTSLESSQLPALAVMIFLRTPETADPEHGQQHVNAKERLEKARDVFRYRPWKFHHSEKLANGKMNVLPGSESRDFYYHSPSLPMWGLRHVHYGREHVRFVLYTCPDTWDDQVNLYTLILGLEPDLLREDFCLFTTFQRPEYDIQFALKRVESDTKVVLLEDVHIQVKVKDMGQLVPLFPNVCRPVSDTEWHTTDHDGNLIILDVVRQIRSSQTKTNKHTSLQTNTGKQAAQTKTDKQTSSQSTNGCVITQTNEQSALYQNTLLTSNKTSLHTEAPGKDVVRSVFIEANSTSSRTLRHLCSTVNDDVTNDDDFELDHVTSSRMNSPQEEDEASLTLTNTSEESGIQVHNASDDLSFCEDEPLKPCLYKLRSSRIRAVKFRVRFKDTVEEFEDETGSRISSGIDSEEQSDDETYARLRYTSGRCTPYANMTDGADAIIVVDQNIPGQTYDNRNLAENRTQRPATCTGTIGGRSSDDRVPSLHPTSLKLSRFNNQELIPPPPYPGNSNHRSAFTHSNTPSENLSQSVLPLNNSSKLSPSPRPPNPPPYSHRHSSPTTPPGVPRGQQPPSYESVRSRRLQESLRPQSTPPVTSENLISQLSPSNTPEPNSSNTQPTSLATQSPVPTETTIRPHSTPPCTSSNIDSKTDPPTEPPPLPPRPSSSCSYSTSNLKSFAPYIRQKQTISYVKKCQDDLKQDKDSPSSTPGTTASKTLLGRSDVCALQTDSPLKFNLKFDTCPTSGLRSREPQIGFYV